MDLGDTYADILIFEAVWSNGAVTSPGSLTPADRPEPQSAESFAQRILAESGSHTALNDFLVQSRARAATISSEFEDLWAEIQRLSTGGKRIRPALVAMAYRAFVSAGTGGSDPRDRAPGHHEAEGHHAAVENHEAVEAVGAAFELLHTALIIHDDVIDRDDRRRHQPTLHAAAQMRAAGNGVGGGRAEHYGHSVGIIAGDLALAGAHRLVATSGLNSAVVLRILDLLDQAVFASAAGELMDIDHALHGADPAPGAILAATSLKTAVYTFEAPLQAGATMAQAGDEQVAALGVIGRDLGLAFQLADDLLGVYGTGMHTGKSTDADLREGKRTLLIARAAATQYGPEVLHLLERIRLGDSAPSSPGALPVGSDPARAGASAAANDDAARLRELLTLSGARAAVESEARAAARRAMDAAAAADLPGGLVEDLRAVANEAVERIR